MKAPQQMSQADILQRVSSLVEQRTRVQVIVDEQTEIVKKLGPPYRNALNQLKSASETKLELDVLIAFMQQLLIEMESNKKDE